MLKKFLIGTFALAVFAFAGTALASYDFGPTTLKVGSTGQYVMTLQTLVGATPVDGVFGPMTKAKVMAWQAANGLEADGLFGNMSKAKANATTTGGTFPAGCTSAVGFSPTTGEKCSGEATEGGETTTGPLQGGAGDVSISTTSTDVKDIVKEGANDTKVLGFKVEADGSDVAVTSLKIVMKNDGFNAGDGSSEKLSNYIDSVDVYMGTTKVGSADVDEFTRESGSPDTFTKSIALSNAVVRDTDENKFFIAVNAVSSIDSEDMDDADWNVYADTLRFQDATGVIMTADVDMSENFTFEDQSTDDQIDAKSSTANPENSTVAVDESSTTDDVLALAFKLKTDIDSSEITVTGIPVTIDVTNFDFNLDDAVNGSDAVDVSAAGAWIDNIIDSVVVKIGDTEVEADMDDFSGANQDLVAGAGTVIFTADFDDGVTIDAGDTEDVKVYITFKGENDNYNNGVVVTASVDVSTIDAETPDDEITVEGSDQEGGDLTLSLSSADVTVSSKTSSSNDDETIGTFSFTFKVEATGDEDLVFTNANTTGNVEWELLGPAGSSDLVPVGTVTLISGDATEDPAGTYTIAAGDTATFSLDVTATTVEADDAGVYRVRLEAVAGTDLGDDVLAGPETLTYVAA